MGSLKRLSRIVLLSLLASVLTLGITPVLTVQAQQSAQAQTASPARTLKEGSPRMTGQQKLAEGERTPLSEEEMAGVEGEWVQVIMGAVAIGLTVAAIWQANHNAHGHPSEIHVHRKWGVIPYVEFHHNTRR